MNRQILHRWVGIASHIFPDGRIQARAAMEDDFHNFRAEVTIENSIVVSARSESPRFPWATCPAGARHVGMLVGKPASALAHSVTRLVNPRDQCTHALDLTGLAIAGAVRKDRLVEYRAAVPCRVDERTQATITRNGTLILSWDVDGIVITYPAPYSSHGLLDGFSTWAIETLDPLTAEAALILRRCVCISLGRVQDLDAVAHSSGLGRCYTEQPHRAPNATRMIGSTHDFTENSDTLGSSDRDWILAVDPTIS